MEAEAALFVCLLAAAYFFFSSIPVSRRIRFLKREIQVEQTRSCWADAREILMKLVRDKKLDPRSDTFKTFYAVQTFVLRRPESFAAIARVFARTILARRAVEQPRWLQERPDWPAEMDQVLDKMAEGTMRLIWYHHGLGWLVVRLFWKVGPWLAERVSKSSFEATVSIATTVKALKTDKILLTAAHRMHQLKFDDSRKPIFAVG